MEEMMPVIREQPVLITESPGPSIYNNGDYCVYKGRKYAINERIEDGCEKICKCMASSANVECEPRCPKHNETASSQCVSFPDPKDSCCHIELCDVTDDDHEQSPVVIVPPPPSFINAKNNRTANGKIRDHEALVATTMTATGDNDKKNKHECEHNGSKYTIGRQIGDFSTC